MNSESRLGIRHLVAILFVVFGSLTLPAPSAAAQTPSDAQLRSALTFCLFYKFPRVRDSYVEPGQTTAFDPQSGRNFAWDKDKGWIDTKTGEAVCPRSKSGLTFCLFYKFPRVRDSYVEPGQTHAFDPDSGRNFAWDGDKQAWIDTKTLECICPLCPPSQAGVPKTTFRLSDPIRMPVPQVSVGETVGSVAQGVVGGLLGGLFGGGRERESPSLPGRPPYPEQPFTSKDGKTKVNISGAADPDSCQFTVGVDESPGDGAPHLIVLQDDKGNILQPSDISVYQIWEAWGGWRVTVSWTKSYYENGRLVKQEKGGWSTPWNIFHAQFKDPSEIPSIWKDFGGKPFGGIRGVIADFKFPEGQTFNPSDWNLVAHVTTKDGDFIQTQPFIMDMKAGENGVLSFTQREATVWDATTP